MNLNKVHFLKPGISPEAKGCKRLKANSSNIVEYSNPFAISDVLNRIDSGKFGSVTKDIEALISRKMQILGPYFARYPRLVNQSLKVVMNPDEETHNKFENNEDTGSSNVIDLEEKHIEKDVPAAPPLPVVILDSDEEDDRDHKSFLPFHEVVLPRPIQSPAIKTVVSFTLLLYSFKCAFYFDCPSGIFPLGLI